MPQINGRTIRASTLAERRLLLSLGTPTLRIPRGVNPYVVARRLGRAARGESPDVMLVRDVANGHKPSHPRPGDKPLRGSKGGPIHASADGCPA